MKTPRIKAKAGTYGERVVQINAKISEDARAGLHQNARKIGLSLNEYLERLGRGLVLPSSQSGES